MQSNGVDPEAVLLATISALLCGFFAGLVIGLSIGVFL